MVRNKLRVAHPPFTSMCYVLRVKRLSLEAMYPASLSEIQEKELCRKNIFTTVKLVLAITSVKQSTCIKHTVEG